MGKKQEARPGRLLEIRMSRPQAQRSYPYSVPALAALDVLEVGLGVTYLVGENGSGKSTLVEAVAIGAGLNPEGGSRNLNFSTRSTESELHRSLDLVWRRQPT